MVSWERKEITEMEHGDIVYTDCLYSNTHNNNEPSCIESCHINGCEYHLVMYEDGYSRFGNETSPIPLNNNTIVCDACGHEIYRNEKKCEFCNRIINWDK